MLGASVLSDDSVRGVVERRCADRSLTSIGAGSLDIGPLKGNTRYE
jgi:hypothetical protein